jgi:hypothetical protein
MVQDIRSLKGLKITANVRVYDHLRCQSDSVSRYTRVTQSDTVRNALPSN